MKDIKTLLLVIICGTAAFLLFYFLNKVTEMKQIWEKAESYQLFFELNNTMTGKTVSDTLFSELNREKPILIIEFSNVICSPCNSKLFMELIELQAVFADSPNSVLILCPKHAKKDLSIFKSNNNIDLPIYYKKNDSFERTSDKFNNAFCFVLNPDRKISQLYIPNVESPDLNKQYLEGVKRFLSE